MSKHAHTCVVRRVVLTERVPPQQRVFTFLHCESTRVSQLMARSCEQVTPSPHEDARRSFSGVCILSSTKKASRPYSRRPHPTIPSVRVACISIVRGRPYLHLSRILAHSSTINTTCCSCNGPYDFESHQEGIPQADRCHTGACRAPGLRFRCLLYLCLCSSFPRHISASEHIAVPSPAKAWGSAGSGVQRSPSALCTIADSASPSTPVTGHHTSPVQSIPRPKPCHTSYHIPPLPPRRPHYPTVRMWLGRIAGSLVIGAVLGGAAAYYALPRSMTGSASPCAAAGSAGAADSTSPWRVKERGVGAGKPGEGSEQTFGDRLTEALFSARAGEAAAQQVLLVRNLRR